MIQTDVGECRVISYIDKYDTIAKEIAIQLANAKFKVTLELNNFDPNTLKGTLKCRYCGQFTHNTEKCEFCGANPL
jgi:recombinational DNA repair protein RecR